MVLTNGLAHEHGSEELLKDVGELGHHEVILKCGGKPALRGAQDEVNRRREAPTILEKNSGMGNTTLQRGPSNPLENR